MDSARAVIKFARHALRAEFLTPAGVVNLIALFSAFVLLLSLGLLDIWQAIVRTWDSTYTTGSSAFVLLFGMYLLTVLVCVLIVGLVTRKEL